MRDLVAAERDQFFSFHILPVTQNDDRLTVSPHFSSGTLMTAASATAGCSKSVFSTSRG